MEPYRTLLNVTSNSSKLKSIPKQITTYKRACEHMATIFVPRIIVPLFGSLYHFLLLLFGVGEIRQMHDTFYAEELNKRIQVEKSKHQGEIKSCIQDCFKRIDEHLVEISPLLLKGCFISANSYEKIRALLSFHLTSMPPSIQLRSSLPKVTKEGHEYMYVLRNGE